MKAKPDWLYIDYQVDLVGWQKRHIYAFWSYRSFYIGCQRFTVRQVKAMTSWRKAAALEMNDEGPQLACAWTKKTIRIAKAIRIDGRYVYLKPSYTARFCYRVTVGQFKKLITWLRNTRPK